MNKKIKCREVKLGVFPKRLIQTGGNWKRKGRRGRECIRDEV